MWVKEDEADTAYDDDDVPWADPQIRLNYEAALGRFILAFNELDYYLSAVIEQEYKERSVSNLCHGLWSKFFAQRLEILEGLASTARLPSVRELPYGEMRDLNVHRNVLAHGHFDQNPFQGDYKVLKQQKVHDFPTERINDITTRLSEIAHACRNAYYAGQFPVREEIE